MKNNFNKTQNKPFQVSNELIDWLNCQTALTEKLQQLTGDARVDVLAMDWDEHNEWEAKQLGIVEVRAGVSINCFVVDHGFLHSILFIAR